MVALVGATPVFADVEEASFNSTLRVSRAIATARTAGIKVKAVIPVDLFGQPADYAAIGAVASAENCSCSTMPRSRWGSYRNHQVARSPRPPQSAYPAKLPAATATAAQCLPTTTNCRRDAEPARPWRGQPSLRLRAHRHQRQARHIQAAILTEKLKIFLTRSPRATRRAALPAALADVAIVPRLGEGMTWKAVSIRLPLRRARCPATALKAQGIPTATHIRCRCIARRPIGPFCSSRAACQ
jgi:hypothetical protein